MQLTKYTDISLRVMMHLAIKSDELGTIKDIAVRYNVSRNHLMKVVNYLVTQGYLKSIQGRGGGILLAIPAEKINVGEVVRTTESTLDLIDCVGSNCPLTSFCILKQTLNEATKAFLQVLDRYTIADLVKNRTQLLRLID